MTVLMDPDILGHCPMRPEPSLVATSAVCRTPGISCERPIRSTLVSFIPLLDIPLLLSTYVAWCASCCVALWQPRPQASSPSQPARDRYSGCGALQGQDASRSPA